MRLPVGVFCQQERGASACGISELLLSDDSERIFVASQADELDVA